MGIRFYLKGVKELVFNINFKFIHLGCYGSIFHLGILSITVEKTKYVVLMDSYSRRSIEHIWKNFESKKRSNISIEYVDWGA